MIAVNSTSSIACANRTGHVDTGRTGVTLKDAEVTIPVDVHCTPTNYVRWLFSLDTGIAQTTARIKNEQCPEAMKLINVY